MLSVLQNGTLCPCACEPVREIKGFRLGVRLGWVRYVSVRFALDPLHSQTCNKGWVTNPREGELAARPARPTEVS